MGLLADERSVISGARVTGSGVTYTLGTGHRLYLELLAFTLVTSAAVATRNPEVLIKAQSGETLATLQDLNDVGASWTVAYTYGVGLTAGCGIGANGGAIVNALPATWLEQGATITLTSLDSTGAQVAGDAFSNVVLYGVASTAGSSLDAIPLLTPLALNSQVAA